MRSVVLYSGGKDSNYALFLAKQAGHSIESLVSMLPKEKFSETFHFLNTNYCAKQAEALQLPIVFGLCSQKKELRELGEILFDLRVKKALEGVVTGVTKSDPQKKMIQKICKHAGLEMIAPLIEKSRFEVMQELVDKEFKAVVVGVLSRGLPESWLGRELDSQALNELIQLEEENQESLSSLAASLETFVLDSPLFCKKLEVLGAIKKWRNGTGKMEFTRVRLKEKKT